VSRAASQAKQVGSKRAQDHPGAGYEQRMKLQELDRSQESSTLGVSACATPKRAAQTAAQGFAPADTQGQQQIKEKGHF